MSSWNETHGHFLTRDEVAIITGMSSDDVVGSPALVRIDGALEEVYPAAQFLVDGSPTVGIDAVVTELSTRLAPRDIAAFLTCPNIALGGKSPIAWLQAGGAVHRVTRLSA